MPMKARPAVSTTVQNVGKILRNHWQKAHVASRKDMFSVTGKQPDFTWRLPDVVIFLEVKQQQHARYDVDREIMRELRLLASCGSKPMIMIRYNPGTQQSDVNSVCRDNALVRFLSHLFTRLKTDVPRVKLTKYSLFYSCYENLHTQEWADGATFLESEIGLQALLDNSK
jgi:hypothetical protein